MKKGTKKSENVATKVEQKNALDLLNKTEIKSELTTKKFAGIDYANMSAKEQKRFRTKVRNQLFKIVDSFVLSVLKKEAKEKQTEILQNFENFIKQNYVGI